MAFIGIITNEKNILTMTKFLKNTFDMKDIIFISNNNIEKFKTMKFETVVVDKEIKNINQLKSIISNSKYLILNADIKIDSAILEDLNLMVITYGFQNKATFTVSSVSENNIIICLQRIMKTAQNGKYEPQEINIKIEQNLDIHAIICTNILTMFYQKRNELISKK